MTRALGFIFVLITSCIAPAANVRGVIRFDGTAPPARTTPGEKCHTGAPAIPAETVVVSKTGELANCVVYVEGATSSDGSSTKAAVLDQKDCRYVPHVLAIQTEQPLVIKSSDDTLHNVHYNPTVNPPANFALIQPGQQKQVSFKSPEIVKISCDVHAWMSAWVVVLENPFFSVTNDSGAFEIHDLPAGSYKLVCWHERFGKQEKALDIATKDLKIDFLYQAPK
jgi:hypothetical protein